MSARPTAASALHWALLCAALLAGCDRYRASFHNGRGLEYYRAGQPVAAASSYREALAIYPDLAEAHSNLGLAFL